MKVFVLSGYFEYDGSQVIGVYTCRCEAKKEEKRLRLDKEGQNGCKYDGYSVEEFTLVEGRS